MGDTKKYQSMENQTVNVAVLENKVDNVQSTLNTHISDDKETFQTIFAKLDKIESKLNMGIGGLIVAQVIIQLLIK